MTDSGVIPGSTEFYARAVVMFTHNLSIKTTKPLPKQHFLTLQYKGDWLQ